MLAFTGNVADADEITLHEAQPTLPEMLDISELPVWIGRSMLELTRMLPMLVAVKRIALADAHGLELELELPGKDQTSWEMLEDGP